MDKHANKELIGILVCLFYGFTNAAANSVIFGCGFMLLTFFTVLYLLCISQMVAKDFNIIKKELIVMSIVIFLSGITHYASFLFEILVSVLLLGIMIIKRKYKSILSFIGCTVVGFFGVFILIPTCFKMALSGVDPADNQSYIFPFFLNVDWLFNRFSRETVGVDWYIDRFFVLDIVAGCLLLIVLSALICFVCRKEKWFKPTLDEKILPFVKRLANKKEVNFFIKKHINPSLCIITVSMLVAVVILAVRVNAFELGIYSNRYIFYMCPLFCMCITYGFIRCLELVMHIKKINWIPLGVTALLVLLIVGGQIHNTPLYLYEDNHTEEIAKQIADSNCIVLTSSACELNWYSYVLYDTNSAFVLNLQTMFDDLEKLNRPEGEKDVYLLVEENCFSEDFEIEDFLDLVGTLGAWIDEIEYVDSEHTCRGNLDLFKIN